MSTRTVGRALLTDDALGVRAVDVAEVGGVLVELPGGLPVDLVSLVVVTGLDELPG